MSSVHLANMLMQIKCGYNSKSKIIYCRYNNICIKILYLLFNNGFIDGFFLTKNGLVGIKLKYYLNNAVINNITLYSTTGNRKYYSSLLLYKKFKNMSCVVVSTHLGIMLHKDAIFKNIGGEVLFYLNFF